MKEKKKEDGERKSKKKLDVTVSEIRSMVVVLKRRKKKTARVKIMINFCDEIILRMCCL